VTLPDWQGLGLALHLAYVVSSALRAMGRRARKYPAHPSYMRAYDRSPDWDLVLPPGTFRGRYRSKRTGQVTTGQGFQGGRPNAVFEYVGPAMASVDDARDLWEGRAVAATTY
jgi:hypothetical protein